MRRSFIAVRLSAIAFFITVLLAGPARPLAQERNGHLTDIVGGDQLAAKRHLDIAHLSRVVVEGRWIVAPVELTGELQLAFPPLTAPSDKADTSWDDWTFERSEHFELDTRIDPEQANDSVLRSYPLYYGIQLKDALSEERLTELLEKAGYEPKAPIEIGWDEMKSGLVSITVPCCEPLDGKRLFRVFDETAISGYGTFIGSSGAVTRGHLVVVLLVRPTFFDEAGPSDSGSRKTMSGLAFFVTHDQ